MAMKILPGVHLDIVNLTCLMARLGRVPPKTRIWEKMETWAVAEALFLASALHISAQVGPRAMKILPEVPLDILNVTFFMDDVERQGHPKRATNATHEDRQFRTRPTTETRLPFDCGSDHTRPIRKLDSGHWEGLKSVIWQWCIHKVHTHPLLVHLGPQLGWHVSFLMMIAMRLQSLQPYHAV